MPVPGYDVRVLGGDGRELPPGETGHLVIRLPLPPGCLRTLWQNDAGFEQKYLSRFPGYYETADAGHVDEDGYLWVMARTDDIINVAGHRLSTGAMEEVLGGHADVAECAVIGVKDELKGQVPLGLVVLNADTWSPGDLAAVTAGWDLERVRLLVAGDDRLRPPDRPARRLAGAAGLPGRHSAEDPGQRSRRDRQDGQPHAPAAL